MMNVYLIRKKIAEKQSRSAWDHGVKLYALELLDELLENCDNGYINQFDIDYLNLEGLLLDGTKNWKEYSWGGGSLIYDSDIANRLCNDTELKKTKNGERKPNKYEEWLDVQARALQNALLLIRSEMA